MELGGQAWAEGRTLPQRRHTKHCHARRRENQNQEHKGEGLGEAPQAHLNPQADALTAVGPLSRQDGPLSCLFPKPPPRGSLRLPLFFFYFIFLVLAPSAELLSCSDTEDVARVLLRTSSSPCIRPRLQPWRNSHLHFSDGEQVNIVLHEQWISLHCALCSLFLGPASGPCRSAFPSSPGFGCGPPTQGVCHTRRDDVLVLILRLAWMLLGWIRFP